MEHPGVNLAQMASESVDACMVQLGMEQSCNGAEKDVYDTYLCGRMLY
jgi:hypothetical protein